MTTDTQTRGALLDRRLMRQAGGARRFLVVATVVGLAATASVVVQAVLVAAVITGAVAHHDGIGTLAPLLVGLAAAFAARALLAWIGSVTAERAAGGIARELRQRLVHRATDLGPSWLAGERTGELSLTATRGISSLEVYFGRYLPQLVLAAVAPLAILVWVGVEDWPSMCILLALLLAVPPVMVVFGRRAQAQTTRQWRTLGSLAARFLEIVDGLPTLRAFGQQARGREEIATATERLRTTTLATLRVAFLSGLALDLIAGLATGLVAMVLGLRLLAGDVALGTALAVLLVSPEVFLPLRRAATEFHASTEGQAAAARVLDVLEHPTPAPRSGPTPVRTSPGAAAPVPAPTTDAWDPSSATLRLRGVSVTYPKRPGPVLDHLDLDLAPGDRVALVGPSGAGKSTVLHLLMRFVEPSDGDLRAGAVDLATLDPATWRRRVSWVPQRPHLFRGTLAQNICMDFRGTTPQSPELAEAVARTGLAPLVARLPQGLETPVGPGGSPLSGGERQLVAIARAVLRSAPLVLLDEPTAHLDPEAAAAVVTLVAEWEPGRTVVVAAHDRSVLAATARTVELGGPPLEVVDQLAGRVAP